MNRRDPIVYGLLLLGFGATYCRGWVPYFVPSYTAWTWWKQGLLRLGIVGLSGLIAWSIITWRLSPSIHPNPAVYWTMWGAGVVAGVVLEEVHNFIDSMFS